MVLTVSQVEKELLHRAGKRMAFVGFDATTNNGSNADLNEPIFNALLNLDMPVVDITGVQDSDLAGIQTKDLLKFFDLAELRLLKNIHGNIDTVDTSADSQTERYSQFADQVQKSIDNLEKHVAKVYGIGAVSLSAGKIKYDFIAKVE